MLLPRRSQKEALELTRGLRQAINAAQYLEDEGLKVRLTASYGIATLPQDAQDREGLLMMADRAMFYSKGRGKDCIMLGRGLTPAPQV
jgi:diguanylate cyclase (GGDEF)-like protein